MPRYQILRMDVLGTPPLIAANGQPHEFTDPADAAKYAKIVSKLRHEKLCVKPVVDEAWRRREQMRVDIGTYRTLPWYVTRWWGDAYPIWKDHYPHPALEKPGWIAYTKSPEDGMKDKQSLLRPGAYLNKYFEAHLKTYGVSERKMVEEFMRMYGPIEVKFATTEEEIIRAYESGPSTCMNDKTWPNDIHPASVYAAGDLSVAYMGSLEGRVSARTLVWQDKKIHSRIYGDIARLTQGLERLGYKWGAPIGAKLKRIQLRDPKYKGLRAPADCFIAPYLDKKNQAGGGHLSVFDRETHLEICEEGMPGSHHCGDADGTSGLYVLREDERPTFVCDNCDKKVDNNLIAVYTESLDEDGNNGEFEQWCHMCTQMKAWNCRYSGQYYTSAVEMVEVGGVYWLPYYADMYAMRCQGNGKLYPEGDMMDIYFKDGTHKWLSREYIKHSIGQVFRSQITNRLFATAYKCLVNSDGGGYFYAATPELVQHAFQCDSCDQHWLIHLRFQPKDDHLLCPRCFKTYRETKELNLSARAQQHNLPLIAAE